MTEEYNGSAFDFNKGDIVWMLDVNDDNNYVMEEVEISEEKNDQNYYGVNCKLAKNFPVPTYILYGTPEKCQKRCDELNKGCRLSNNESSWFGGSTTKIDLEETRHSPWGMYMAKRSII